MPDFSFTSPEGKSYTVSGPEGATKEQAFQVLQQQLSAGTAHEDAGTATPQEPAPAPKSTSERIKDSIAGLRNENPLTKLGPSNAPVPSPTLAGAAKSIAGSAAFGGVAAALSPEIVTGLGVAAMAIPGVGEAVGPALMETGAALRAVRPAIALQGAATGAVSEGAGQVAEATGATKGQAEAARLVGGMLTPSAGAVAGFVSKPVKLAWNLAQKMVGTEASIPKQIETARQNMAALKEAGQPETALHAMLQKGDEANRQAAQKAADAAMAEGHETAARLARTNPEAANRAVEDARAHAASIMSDAAKQSAALLKASNGKTTTATRVLAQTAPELAKVGQVRELSDIGKDVREAVTVKQGAEIEARTNTYKATVAERDAAVAAKEATGQSVDNEPSLVALKKDLATKLGTTKGFVNTADAGVRRGYQQVEDAITRKTADTGLLDANGQPIKQQFKTSFEALDHVRRRLGDVIAGRPVEGYDAIGKQAAQRMYAQISKAQEEFVGANAEGKNIQRTLQQDYAEGSEGLTKFGSKAGQKATALDRVDPERFANDPKGLASHYFSSQQGVRDLRELTGNNQLVDRMASDYAARSLQGKSASEVSKWIRENNDWTREVPGLNQRLKGFEGKRAQIEDVNDKLLQRAKVGKGKAEAVQKEAFTAAEKAKQGGVARASDIAERGEVDRARVLKDAGEKSETAQKEAYAPAEKLQNILKSGEAPESVRKLLLTGAPEQTRLAARMLVGQPGGQQVLEQSVRQTMRNMTEGTLQHEWTTRLRPMLQDGKMLPPERLAALEADVDRLLASYKGKDKLSMVQRHIAAALGTAPSVAAGSVQRREE